jgi:hypothetical protein
MYINKLHRYPKAVNVMTFPMPLLFGITLLIYFEKSIFITETYTTVVQTSPPRLLNIIRESKSKEF